MLYIIQHRRSISTLPFVAVRPDCHAGAFEHPCKTSAALPDYPILIARKLVPDNLRNDNVNNLLAAECFKRAEERRIGVAARQVEPDAGIEKKTHRRYRVDALFLLLCHFSPTCLPGWDPAEKAQMGPGRSLYHGAQIPSTHTAALSRAAAAGLVQSLEVAQGKTWGFQVLKGTRAPTASNRREALPADSPDVLARLRFGRHRVKRGA